MDLTVIVPVGPGHEKIANRAFGSIMEMPDIWPFKSLTTYFAFDPDGKKGRSKARNEGIKACETDWIFFLDADDIMEPYACCQLNTSVSATFGKRKFIIKKNPRIDFYPCSFLQIKEHGSSGTLSMGFFCKTEVAKSLLFNENMNIAEDFDFYMRLPSFIKVSSPLVTIGDDVPGVSGGHELNWSGECRKVIDKYARTV